MTSVPGPKSRVNVVSPADVTVTLHEFLAADIGKMLVRFPGTSVLRGPPAR